jgi:hypothetical protein
MIMVTGVNFGAQSAPMTRFEGGKKGRLTGLVEAALEGDPAGAVEAMVKGKKKAGAGKPKKGGIGKLLKSVLEGIGEGGD